MSQTETTPNLATADQEMQPESVLPIAVDIGMGELLHSQGLSEIDVDAARISQTLMRRGWTEEDIADHLVVIKPTEAMERMMGASGAYYPRGRNRDEGPLIEIVGKNQTEINIALAHELSHATGDVRRDPSLDAADIIYEPLMKKRTQKAVPLGAFYGAIAGFGLTEVTQGVVDRPLAYAAVGVFALFGARVGFDLAYWTHPAERRARREEKLSQDYAPVVTFT